jgi:hypothetical protein
MKRETLIEIILQYNYRDASIIPEVVRLNLLNADTLPGEGPCSSRANRDAAALVWGCRTARQC